MISDAQQIAEAVTILRATVGSRLHGLALEGTDDRDEMGVCIEPPEYVVGTRQFEQWVHRTQPEGVRSGPGDIDLTIYGLRKFIRLAMSGNPTIILLLFAPAEFLHVCTPAGERLQALAPALLSRRAGTAFLGYLTAQKQRLLGERGQKRVKRPELEDAHGYDTKYAMHILRLGLQGVELLTTGRLTLPLPDGQRQFLLQVRRGEWSLDSVLTAAGIMERDLEDLRHTSPLPEEPDRAAVDRFLIDEYVQAWATALAVMPGDLVGWRA